MSDILEVRELRAYYGRVQALHGIDLSLREGSVTTLLGANGAGKTTTLRSICSMVTLREPSVSTGWSWGGVRPKSWYGSELLMFPRGAGLSRA